MRRLTLAQGPVSVAFTLLVLARTINQVADALVERLCVRGFRAR